MLDFTLGSMRFVNNPNNYGANPAISQKNAISCDEKACELTTFPLSAGDQGVDRAKGEPKVVIVGGQPCMRIGRQHADRRLERVASVKTSRTSQR